MPAMRCFSAQTWLLCMPQQFVFDISEWKMHLNKNDCTNALARNSLNIELVSSNGSNCFLFFIFLIRKKSLLKYWMLSNHHDILKAIEICNCIQTVFFYATRSTARKLTCDQKLGFPLAIKLILAVRLGSLRIKNEKELVLAYLCQLFGFLLQSRVLCNVF